MEGQKRKSIGVFWDYENARPISDASIIDLSNRIRDILLPYGDIVSRRVYYDSQASSELKTNRTDIDMTGWTLVDCPRRQKKETLDKKLIVDMMFFIAYENPHHSCICLISGDGDFCYVMNRVRDLGVYTFLIYPEKITYQPLIINVDESYSWETEILKKEKLDKRKLAEIAVSKVENERKYLNDTTDTENDEKVGDSNSDTGTTSLHSNDEPDDIALMIYLNSVDSALSRSKDSEKALDALIAEIWYKQMSSDNGTILQETKDWYKSIRKRAKDLEYITVTENKDTPGHITRYAALTILGKRALRDRTSSF